MILFRKTRNCILVKVGVVFDTLQYCRCWRTIVVPIIFSGEILIAQL